EQVMSSRGEGGDAPPTICVPKYIRQHSFKDKVQVIRPLPGREKPLAPLYPWQHFNTVFQPMPMRFAQRGAMRLPICPEGVDGRMVDMGRFGHGTTYGLHQN